MDEYPLLECKDCINRNGCELIPKINDLVDTYSYLDISSSACEEYTTEHVIDNNWMAYTGNSPVEEEDLEPDYDEPTVSDMFASLEEGLDETIARGYKPMHVEMSFETMQLFLSDDLKGATIKNLASKKHGNIKVSRNDSMITGYFSLALQVIRLEEDDYEDEDEDLDGDI